jgi:hypothetical protein
MFTSKEKPKTEVGRKYGTKMFPANFSKALITGREGREVTHVEPTTS